MKHQSSFLAFGILLIFSLGCSLGNSFSLFDASEPVYKNAPEQITERPINGARLSPSCDGRGSGELTVENNGSVDAIIRVVDFATGELCEHIYIRSGMNYTLENVRNGIFEIKFSIGERFSPADGLFTQGVSYEVFDETIKLGDLPTPSGFRRHVMTVMLGPTIDGNATTTEISPEDFNKKSGTTSNDSKSEPSYDRGPSSST